ncbi:MAG: gliding motility protein GldL [Crocinitomicaceae bacterium]|nr:gliding motility protein GldL [Crocinitomicaceae bacterium]|tara:strand:+ start:14317 stop:15159 length:843 start_codon:yes stop_codon:yes gene_type:complete
MSGKKGGLANFLYGTEKGKTIVNMAMSLGAAIVILGALFKIQHYPGASIMLIVGLCTESALFALGAIEPQHLANDWSRVYPELAHNPEDDEMEDEFEGEAALEDDGLTASQKLDKMMEEANIGPDLINSLGRGLEGLKNTTDQLNDMSNASVATEEYVNSVRNASNQVSSLSDTYVKAASSIAGLAEENESGVDFGEQLGRMSKNLTELNASYELQLQSAQETLENSKNYFNGMDEVMSSLNSSVGDAKVYAEAISELSKNISSLNNIYGNMLTAMNPNN